MTQTHAAPARPTADSGSVPRLTGYRRGFDIAYATLSGLFLLAVAVQVFLAGLGAFHHHGDPGPGFGPHVALGDRLGLAATVVALVALVARASGRTVVGALVLAVLTEVGQHGLAQLGSGSQWFGALHALNATVILLLAAGLARSAVRRVRRR